MKRFLLAVAAFAVTVSPVRADEGTESEKSVFEIIGEAFGTAAEKAGEIGTSVSEKAGEIGTAVSEKAGEIGTAVSGKAGEIGTAVSEKAGEIGTAVSGKAGEIGTAVSKKAGEIGTAASEKSSELSASVRETAEKIAESVSRVSGDAAAKAGEAAEQALDSLSGAANAVADGAGNVIDAAETTAGKVSDAAQGAYEIIRESGHVVLTVARAAVESIDLSDPESEQAAREAIAGALEQAYERGWLGKATDRETLDVLTEIVSSTLIYGNWYAKNRITLSEYAALMSEMIIREGLPGGVGFLADRLPIPGARTIAVKVTTFLIEAIYGEKEPVVFSGVEEPAAVSQEEEPEVISKAEKPVELPLSDVSGSAGDTGNA